MYLNAHSACESQKKLQNLKKMKTNHNFRKRGHIIIIPSQCVSCSKYEDSKLNVISGFVILKFLSNKYKQSKYKL